MYLKKKCSSCIKISTHTQNEDTGCVFKQSMAGNMKKKNTKTKFIINLTKYSYPKNMNHAK